MDLKNLKINKETFSLKKIKESSWNFLLNKFGFIFMSIFILAAIIGSLIIYKYMYSSEWSEAEKNEYRLQVENSKTPFDIDKFTSIVEKIKERNALRNSEVLISKDIFGTTE